ncbi:MAG TPA: hypothetical protein VJC39_05305 [Candidatus Nanoarchaeia archaeon]|nr:hypothetical protein [Candidatus Nanoarchaeia archaeon]
MAKNLDFDKAPIPEKIVGTVLYTLFSAFAGSQMRGTIKYDFGIEKSTLAKVLYYSSMVIESAAIIAPAAFNPLYALFPIGANTYFFFKEKSDRRESLESKLK